MEAFRRTRFYVMAGVAAAMLLAGCGEKIVQDGDCVDVDPKTGLVLHPDCEFIYKQRRDGTCVAWTKNDIGGAFSKASPKEEVDCAETPFANTPQEPSTAQLSP